MAYESEKMTEMQGRETNESKIEWEWCRRIEEKGPKKRKKESWETCSLFKESLK